MSLVNYFNRIFVTSQVSRKANTARIPPQKYNGNLFTDNWQRLYAFFISLLINSKFSENFTCDHRLILFDFLYVYRAFNDNYNFCFNRLCQPVLYAALRALLLQ